MTTDNVVIPFPPRAVRSRAGGAPPAAVSSMGESPACLHGLRGRCSTCPPPAARLHGAQLVHVQYGHCDGCDDRLGDMETVVDLGEEWFCWTCATLRGIVTAAQFRDAARAFAEWTFGPIDWAAAKRNGAQTWQTPDDAA